jgi:4-amino-4-deoxy-L-arabinose transferase-like glycosyltransferase
VTRRPWLIVALVAAVPRLAVLLHERAAILSSFTEKSDDIAQTFVKTGTFGFIPGHPTGWTQPLYAWFLIPIYWIFGRSWWAVGLIQIAVAVGTALLVYELGRRFVSKRVGLVAAIVATLNPYLVWHDVHENREILDQFLAVAIVLCVLVLARRRSFWLAAVLGVTLGLAILGNTRLLFLPILCCAFLLGREQRTWAVVGVVLAGCVLSLLPWLVRNEVSVGCFTLTTDTRALWKANNLNTYATLAQGKWIDDVPPLPNEPPTPEFAGAYYKVYGKVLPVDECARMRVYRHLVVQFWQDHPGEKARLARQAAGMLWDPQAIRTEGRAESGGAVDALRRWAQPAYSIPLFVLGVLGVLLLPGRLALLGVALLAYQTLVAAGFAGATRYRVPWDFLIALGAAAAVWWAVDRRLSPAARRRHSAA